MLTLNEGRKAVTYSRMIIEEHVGEKSTTLPTFEPVFHEKRGVFVTLHTFPGYDLRGCIGIPQPVMALKEAIREAAVSSTHDPRFIPLTSEELDSIIIEITILTTPNHIKVDSAEDYLDEITIGKDGLILEYFGRTGLLLPQVAVEYGWDAKKFLSHLCLKAGVAEDTWMNKDAKIYSFSGQIFSETRPHGDIEEKTIDGI